MTSPVCDYCEGTGRVWEPCHVGYAHEYVCDCPQTVLCANCCQDEGSDATRYRTIVADSDSRQGDGVTGRKDRP